MSECRKDTREMVIKVYEDYIHDNPELLKE